MSAMNIDDIAAKVMETLQKEMSEMGHVNIIVAGKTGVGKSTLVNSVFRGKLADTGIGAPVTQTIKLLTKKDFPLRIYDTVGLELGSDRQRQAAEEINETIKKALASRDDDQYIHCIWYCINVNSNRLEPTEEAFIEQLAKDNLHTNVPVVIVLTLAHNKKASRQMKEYIDDRNLSAKGVCIVLAEDYVVLAEDEGEQDYCKKAYGAEELIKFTIDLLPESVHKAFINAQNASLELKRNKAQRIIAGSAATSFAQGMMPIPFSDAALLVPTQIGMIAAITAVYGLSIDKSMISAIVSSIAGTSGATVAGKTLVTNLLKFIPGAGSVVGGAISGGTAAALTTALGQAYIVVMEMISKGEIKESDLKSKKLADTLQAIFKQAVTGDK